MTELELTEAIINFLRNMKITNELGNPWVTDKIAFATGLEESCIGFSMQKWGEPFIVYDVEKANQILVDRDGMSYSEAEEFLGFNTWDLWTDGVFGYIMLKENLFDEFEIILEETNEDAILFPRFKEAEIGILERKCSPSRALYGLELCVKIEAKLANLTEDIALEVVLDKFFRNITDNSPTVLWPITGL